MENLMNFYPCGMLNRNQRTILTTSLLKENIDTNLILQQQPQNETNLIKLYKSDNKNPQQIINNNNKNHIKLNNNNRNNLNNLCNNNNKLIKTLNYCNNQKSTKTFMKSWNKLKSLLACIVLFVLFLKPAYAKPIISPNMENSSNNGKETVDFNQIKTHENKKCQLLKNVVTIALNRYQTIINELNDDYTQKMYKLDHLKHHGEWILNHIEALHPPEGKLNFVNYTPADPPDNVVQHLYRNDLTIEEKSIKEVLNIYKRFKLILNGIEQLIKTKEADGNFNVEHDASVMNFFKKQETNINELLTEIEMGLKTLRIEIPQINNNIIEYKNEGFDWITIREYLKLLVYTIKAFNILIENCQT